jgi:uncharacterized protein (DUF488 family)
VKKLATIGYEETTIPRFLAALTAAGVRVVADVRAVAGSRRPGFAKTRLAESLRGAGIEYVHLRGLGTPAEGRAAARAGDHEEMRRVYRAHLDSPAAREDMRRLVELVEAAELVCLLCLEADPAHCHRSLVADEVAAALPLRIQHLRVASE